MTTHQEKGSCDMVQESQEHRDLSAQTGAPSVEHTMIPVESGILNRLMTLTGELVLARNRVVQLAALKEINRHHFRTVAHRLHVVVSELQATMMKTRMQPVSTIFDTLPGVVQELSQVHGKRIEFRMKGQQTELDRTVLDAIKAPVMHLVRNAIEHRIEPPDVRRKQGKSPAATLTVRASHKGGQVQIEIFDDGAGGDCQGLDGITTQLDRIGGTVDVHSDRQQGSTITLEIPLTLAIIPALIVTAAKQQFAIPQANLEEVVMLERHNGNRLETVSGAEVYRLRGELLPVLRLNQVLRLPSQAPSDQHDTHMMVVSTGTARFGLIVDQVRDTEEIVVKPLSSHIRPLPCYDGATMMSDGDVALILNVNGLLTVAQCNPEELPTSEHAELEQEDQPGAASRAEQQQTIVLFRTSNNEYYGVPLAFVTRLEDFAAIRIESSGGREVLQYQEKILPLMRLESCLNLPPAPDPETLSLIVFSVEKPIGLVVNEILTTVEISTHIDTETFQQKGVLGSTIVDGHSVLILDIHGVIELAYPHWYQKFFVSKLTEEDRQQIRVLLVEDSGFFLNIEQSYLESAGYQVMTATDGNEAVHILEEQPVDVVVTDIDMPSCDGYELTKIIRSQNTWKHLPVMALTALSGEKDRQKGMEAGIDAYTIKLDRENVLSTLERLILRRT